MKLIKFMKLWLCKKKLEKKYGAKNVNIGTMMNIAIYPKLGLTYTRIKKNANTSTVILLRELETGLVENTKDAKDNSLRFTTLPLVEINKLHRYKHFVIIRNPYARLLSAFLDKFRQEEYSYRFGNFSLDSYGFNNFILWLENGGLQLNAHWDLQIKRIFLPLDKYDGVIRFEHFKDEMHAFFQSQGIKLETSALNDLYPSDQSKKTSASSRIGEFYNDDVANRVYELFKTDFEYLGYLKKLPE